MDGGDPVLKDVANVAALLFLPKFVSVTDGVMVFICGVMSKSERADL